VSDEERPGPFPVLTGPTGVGKTELSLSLAESIGAEIISCDSRQVYRGLDIGTAKPTTEQRRRVRHHFIDELDLNDEWTAGRFAREAEARIAEVLERGAVPLVVGGSTLYLQALVHGLAHVPAAPAAIRAAVTAEASTEAGRRVLLDELRASDPSTAAMIDPANPHRLGRAVEVLRATGRPISSFRREVPRPAFRYDVEVLTRDSSDLRGRVNARVDAMLAEGLLDENRRLLDAGVSREAPALRTIGYSEPMAHLAGEIGYDEMVAQLKRNTWAYARRQLTWLRRHREYRWTVLPADA
jgi:tRNA dimethylallyltransferase